MLMLVECITHNYIFYVTAIASAAAIAKFLHSSLILALVSLMFNGM
jgi:hypothetical protein